MRAVGVLEVWEGPRSLPSQLGIESGRDRDGMLRRVTRMCRNHDRQQRRRWGVRDLVGERVDEGALVCVSQEPSGRVPTECYSESVPLRRKPFSYIFSLKKPKLCVGKG